MGVTVCPIAVVAAPVEVVWANLVQWERYSEWADVQVERIEPEGPASVGQTIYFTGMVLHFTFKTGEFVSLSTHLLSKGFGDAVYYQTPFCFQSVANSERSRRTMFDVSNGPGQRVA